MGLFTDSLTSIAIVRALIYDFSLEICVVTFRIIIDSNISIENIKEMHKTFGDVVRTRLCYEITKVFPLNMLCVVYDRGLNESSNIVLPYLQMRQ